MFPILNDDCVKAIPWAAMAPHERQAIANHGQSLKALASRGGLDVTEAEAIMIDRKLRFGAGISADEVARARANLMNLVWLFERDRTVPQEHSEVR